jgi:hypothetical protein
MADEACVNPHQTTPCPASQLHNVPLLDRVDALSALLQQLQGVGPLQEELKKKYAYR